MEKGSITLEIKSCTGRHIFHLLERSERPRNPTTRMPVTTRIIPFFCRGFRDPYPVGGFKPSEKYDLQIGSFSQVGMKIKTMFGNHHPVTFLLRDPNLNLNLPLLEVECHTQHVPLDKAKGQPTWQHVRVSTPSRATPRSPRRNVQ